MTTILSKRKLQVLRAETKSTPPPRAIIKFPKYWCETASGLYQEAKKETPAVKISCTHIYQACLLQRGSLGVRSSGGTWASVSSPPHAGPSAPGDQDPITQPGAATALSSASPGLRPHKVHGGARRPRGGDERRAPHGKEHKAILHHHITVAVHGSAGLSLAYGIP